MRLLAAASSGGRGRFDRLDLLGLAAVGLLVLTGAGRDPAQGLGLTCPVHAVTGLDCPGCGSLRATHDLLHGEVLAAADHHLLLVVLLPVALTLWARRLGRAVRGRRPRAAPARGPFTTAAATWAGPATVVVLLAWTVLRNLPGAPFGVLAA